MTRRYHGVHLTDSFEDSPEGRARAKKVLQHYFRPLSKKNTGYTGGVWDTFDPSGTRKAIPNEFTAEDLVACALLSTAIPGRAVVELLDSQRTHFDSAGGRPRFAQLLKDIGPDRPFVDVADPANFDFCAVRELYRALSGVWGIGETRATKLIARKRPHLVPIVDDVIDKVICKGSGVHWAPMHVAFTAEDCALWRQLVDLKREAELPDAVPVVRVFDVLAWMDGTGKAAYALEQ